MSQIKYHCKTCGREHIGLPDIGYDSPHHYASASPEEQKRDFVLTADTCTMKDAEGEHYFVRGVLLIPILATKEHFGWGVWVSLSQKNFDRYVALNDDSIIEKEPPYFGWFCTNIPGYPTTLSLKAKVELQTGNQRPLITLEPGPHPLSKEQHEGITIERAIELARPYLHPQTPPRTK
jgi:hypothetical protein